MYNCFACNHVVYEGVSVTPQDVAVGENVSFTKVLGAGLGLCASEGAIQIAEAGVYLINVSVTESVDDACECSNIGVQLYNNAEPVLGAMGEEYSCKDQSVNVAFSAIIKVAPTCCPLDDNSANLTLVGIGEDAIVSNVIVTVTRL